MTKIAFGYAAFLLLLNHILHSQSLACPVPPKISFPLLSCYMSYSLFLSLWALLHGSHFLLRRCSSFLTYIHFPCTRYISHSLPSESNFTLPRMCSLFILWQKSINTYEPKWHKRASKNMAVSGFFLLILQENLLWPFLLSFLSQSAVFSILLCCISNCPRLKKGSQLHPLFLHWYSWRASF